MGHGSQALGSAPACSSARTTLSCMRACMLSMAHVVGEKQGKPRIPQYLVPDPSRPGKDIEKQCLPTCTPVGHFATVVIITIGACVAAKRWNMSVDFPPPHGRACSRSGAASCLPARQCARACPCLATSGGTKRATSLPFIGVTCIIVSTYTCP